MRTLTEICCHCQAILINMCFRTHELDMDLKQKLLYQIKDNIYCFHREIFCYRNCQTIYSYLKIKKKGLFFYS